MKKKSGGYILNFVLIIGLTLLVLCLALKDNFEEIVGLMFNVPWYWLVLIIVWGIVYNCIIGWILTIFGRKYKKNYSFKSGLENAFVGSFFSGVTPSSTGGQFAQAYVFKRQGIRISDGASLLWADFIIYQTTMMIYVTTLFFLRFAYFYDKNSLFLTLVLIGYCVNICVICALWTMALFPKVYIKLSHWAVHILSRIHIVKNRDRTLAAWTTQLDSFTIEIKRLKRDKALIIKTVLINILRMTVQYSLPWVIAYAMGIDLPFAMLIDVIAMSSFVSMANTFIPIPGASGGTEWAFVLIFSTIMDGTIAKSIMILWRFSTYHLVMIIGGLLFVLLKRRYDKDKHIKVKIDIFDENIEQEALS